MSRSGLRILIGAGSFADATAGLHLVRYLQANTFAGLGGILIEDADMIAACQLPDQRIVLSSGITSRAPDLSKLRTLLQADARAFRKLLEQTAKPRETEWAFTQDKGELVSTALRAARDWDVLVLGYRQLHNVPGKIVLLQSSAPPSEAMTEAAQNLSDNRPDRNVAFTVTTQTPGARSHSAPNQFRFATLQDALTALTRMNARAVLVDLARGPVQDQSDLLQLLEAARCPVIVFGPASFPALLEHTTQVPDPRAKDDG